MSRIEDIQTSASRGTTWSEVDMLADIRHLLGMLEATKVACEYCAESGARLGLLPSMAALEVERRQEKEQESVYRIEALERRMGRIERWRNGGVSCSDREDQ